MQTKIAYVVLAALASAAAVGCGSSSGGAADPTAAQRASLHRSKDCGDLLGDLKNDAIFKLTKDITQQIAGIRACQAHYTDEQCNYWGGYYGGGVIAEDAAFSEKGAPTPPAAPTAAGADSSAAGGSLSSNRATSFSQTNTQVAGVDEADIVKNDDKNLYILHGNTFKVVNAWPAAELKEVGSLTVEGTPSEMFVANGKAVIYSNVNGQAIFDKAGVKPKDQYQEYVGYAVPASSASSGVAGGIATDAAIAPYPGDNGYYTTPYAPLTKVTVLSLADIAHPAVTSEVYFEGNYLDSRRVDSHVRTVFQSYAYGPKLKYGIYDIMYPNGVPAGQQTVGPKTGTESIAQLQLLLETNKALINNSTIDQWLPYTFVKTGDAVKADTIACPDFYVPTIGSTENGMTEVVSFDLNNEAAPPKQTGILGHAETVYADANTLYIAATAWNEPPFVWEDRYAVATPGGTSASPPVQGSGGVADPMPATPPSTKPASLGFQTTPAQPYTRWSSNRTHLHKFEFATDPTFPNYQASGTVAGQVKDQFSLDQKDGTLRVATSENLQYITSDQHWGNADFAVPQKGQPAPAYPYQVNHVSTFQQQGPWLEQVGTTGDLAPNESIYSVRFVANRGYLVTYRQVDPLFVLDLANPATPNVIGELTIPGFSEYMHPLDDNHLLTIGRNADRSLELKIFDVTNGAAPTVAKSFTYVDQYGSSDAEYDHKAFTYFADKGLLAFPYQGSGLDGTWRSSLEIFKVGLDDIKKLGSVDQKPLVKDQVNGYYCGYYAPSVRRGVFLENFVYSISYGGVVAKDSNNLSSTGTSLALEAPEVNVGYGPTCAMPLAQQ